MEKSENPKTVRVSTAILFFLFVLVFYVFVIRWRHVRELDAAQDAADAAQAALSDCRTENASIVRRPRSDPMATRIAKFNCGSALSALMESAEGWQQDMLKQALDNCTRNIGN